MENSRSMIFGKEKFCGGKKGIGKRKESRF